MTIQQLRYIVEVNRHRSFAIAAEVMGITQPTVSAMILKLEEELDVRIFERTSRKVIPTVAGRHIISQAEKVCAEYGRIGELLAEAKSIVSGELKLGVAPSISPYIVPGFIRHYTAKYAEVNLSVSEMRPEDICGALMAGDIDAGIAVAGFGGGQILEIPLYTEPFHVYLSSSCKRRLDSFTPDDLDHEQMWIVKDAQCLRESAFSFCTHGSRGRRIYEAGSIDTLIRVVDQNGGFTIIPAMHIPFLSEGQRANVRPIDEAHKSVRRVSMYISSSYIRERMLNSIVDSLKAFIPAAMMDKRLLRRGIKL